ncbi:TSC22 domain family protein 4-like [Heptranchias perlo]|uniref:TSC22 domain family protein 4-like n=1 Tax=Heptranchias perlo TaxID=212740 RepID=UPI00355A4A0B
MISKKKSGFQITSVTSDYDGGEGLKEALNGEAEAPGPFAPLVNGGPSYPSGTNHPAAVTAEPAKDSFGGGPAVDQTPPSSAMGAASNPASGGAAAARGSEPSTGQPSAAKEAGAAAAAGLAPSSQPKETAPLGSKFAAGSPLKNPCLSPGSSSHHLGGSCSSRFRVVKLDHALGEPYRRGRWTCMDLYDKDLDSHVLLKVLDSARHVNSLDSHLELGSFTHKAVSQLRPKLHVPKSQGSPPVPCQGEPARGKASPEVPSSTLNMLIQAAKTLSLAGPALIGADAQSHLGQHVRPAPASPPRLSVHIPAPGGRGQASDPAGRSSVGTAASAPSVSVTVLPKEPIVSKSDSSLLTLTSKEQLKPSLVQPQISHGAKGTLVEQAGSNQLASNVSQPSSGEQGGIGKVSEPRSASASPAPLAQDGSPSRKARASEANAASSLRFVSPMQTLAKSMLSVGTHQDGDDDSGSSSSMVAIDNKIEQAMDLVKSHLMYAVREEVEVLKEQIKELIDRNSLLERENALLKSLANPDQLSQLQAQMRSAGSSGGSSGSPSASAATA